MRHWIKIVKRIIYPTSFSSLAWNLHLYRTVHARNVVYISEGWYAKMKEKENREKKKEQGRRKVSKPRVVLLRDW